MSNSGKQVRCFGYDDEKFIAESTYQDDQAYKENFVKHQKEKAVILTKKIKDEIGNVQIDSI